MVSNGVDISRGGSWEREGKGKGVNSSPYSFLFRASTSGSPVGFRDSSLMLMLLVYCLLAWKGRD
jgi:hypothetical protein